MQSMHGSRLLNLLWREMSDMWI